MRKLLLIVVMSMLGFGGYSEQQESVERDTEVEKQSMRSLNSLNVVVSPDEIILAASGELFTFFISVEAEHSCSVKVESSDGVMSVEEFFWAGEEITLAYQYRFWEYGFHSIYVTVDDGREIVTHEIIVLVTQTT